MISLGLLELKRDRMRRFERRSPDVLIFYVNVSARESLLE